MQRTSLLLRLEKLEAAPAHSSQMPLSKAQRDSIVAEAIYARTPVDMSTLTEQQHAAISAAYRADDGAINFGQMSLDLVRALASIRMPGED